MFLVRLTAWTRPAFWWLFTLAHLVTWSAVPNISRPPTTSQRSIPNGCTRRCSTGNRKRLHEEIYRLICFFDRSFSAMLGMSTNPRDRYNWFTKTRFIASEGHTLANKTVLAFMWIWCAKLLSRQNYIYWPTFCSPPLVVGQNNIYLSVVHARTQVENV